MVGKTLYCALLLSAFPVQAATHYVDVNSTNPVAPYTSWATAASVIQDAMDAAATHDTVLVTNGVYDTGGRVMVGDLTNRVVLDKPITLQSVNGPDVTVIQGAWDPLSTNGPLAARCVWLADGAILTGFAVRHGATRSEGDFVTLGSGGGIWCSSSDVLVTHCIIDGNSAFSEGAGCYSGTLEDCLIVSNVVGYGGAVSNSKLFDSDIIGNRGGGRSSGAIHSELWRCNVLSNSALTGGGLTWCSATDTTIEGNSAGQGGGAFVSSLTNCTISDNTALDAGGGISSSVAVNCLITRNRGGRGGGVWGGALHNCNVLHNSVSSGASGGVRKATVYNSIIYANTPGNYYEGSYAYTCTTPTPGGVGNIGADPLLLAPGRLASTSPCRGNGSAAYAVGADMDGEPWLNPPSIGCDEVHDAGLTGALAVAISVAQSNAVVGLPVLMTGIIQGLPARAGWDFGDGVADADATYRVSHTWASPGDYTVTFTAFNKDNLSGVSTNMMMRVETLASPTLTITPKANNQFTLEFVSQPDVRYAVQKTSSLSPPVTWSTIEVILDGSGGPEQVTDSAATGAMRFYRVVVP